VPGTIYPPTLRQAGGRQLWLPIGFRGRGAPGSGGNYDSTSNSVVDQTSWQAPSFSAVKAVRLVYAGFDVTGLGEVDRGNTVTALNASVYQPGRNNALPLTVAAASGATTLGFTPSQGTTPFGNIKAGQLVTATSGIAANTYVVSSVTSYTSANVPNGQTVTLSNPTTATLPVGTLVTFSGDITPAKFGGSRTGRLEPMHAALMSDPMPVAIPAGAQFFVRTFAQFSASGFQIADTPTPATGTTRLTGEFSMRGTGLVDQTLNPSTGSNTGGGYWTPVTVLGLLTTTAPAVLILGDSIAAGTGDGADANGRMGFIQKSLSNNTPWVSLARGSTTAGQAYQSGNVGFYAFAVETGITDVLMQWCRNDIFIAASSALYLRQILTTLAAPFVAAGQRVWAFTCLPYTTSSDGWVSAASQSFAGGTLVSLAAPASAGATTLSVTSTSGVAVGQAVSAPGVTGSNAVAAVGGGTITLASGLTSSMALGSQFVCSTLEQNRLAYNADIRANFASYGFAGLVDAAVVVEDPANAGKWATASGIATTADGIHPNPAGHAALIASNAVRGAMFAGIASFAT
jgi:hypothetical protein